MKIVIASDHRGFAMKEHIWTIVSELGHECIDFGCFDEQPVDYPEMAYAAAVAVVNHEAERAILICSSGMGMCIAANKVKGIRAVTCYDQLNARVSRTHNNANVLCLPGDLLGSDELRKMVDVWLNTEFSGGRHERRLKKIELIEEGRDPRMKSQKDEKMD
ncbi:MAG: ribose 5-phosphate isomerase B [Sedimentisphaerales bacterium]|nr:ribose 5-phosphate isomerase B [Sedimentisphaerales bacterium]